MVDEPKNMSKTETKDLSDAYQRYLFCTDHIDKAIRELGGMGIETSDIMEAISHVVVSTVVMNGISKESMFEYFGQVFDRAKAAAAQAQVILSNSEAQKS